MKWTEVQAGWKDLGKKFQTKWPKLTDADIKAIAGKREELITRLEKAYKTDKVKLGQEVEAFIQTLKAKV